MPPKIVDRTNKETKNDCLQAKKKRGPYKKYNLFKSTAPIPRRTLFRWRKKSIQQITESICQEKIFYQPTNYGKHEVRHKINKEPERNLSANEKSEVDKQTDNEVSKIDFEQECDTLNDKMDVETSTHPENHTFNTFPKKNDSQSTTEIPKKHLINNLLVMTIKWRRRTTHTVAQDILKLVNIASNTDNSHSSKYYWKKILDRYSQSVSTYYICEECNNDLGSESNCPTNCGNCKTKIDHERNKGTFLHLPLIDQLREIFETTDAHQLYSRSRNKINKNAIEDIYDGKMYKKYIQDDSMISINFSVDGAPMFDSSNTSVYPVLCTINELNPYDRRKYILLSSVWFGVGKPKNMNSYLKPFVDEAKTLLKEGFTYSYQGQSYKKSVVTLMGVCDSVARPLLRCSTQFNGKFGCGLCLHPGQSMQKGRGYVRIYPLINGNPFGDGLRTHEQTLMHAEAKTKEEKKGIKVMSVLCEIPNYDIINNLDADWMHSVGLGVCRQFANLWFDSTNSEEKFYFGDKIKEFDRYITSFAPTSEISRTPRPLSDRVHMKAHEWIIFLLAYLQLTSNEDVFP